MLSQQISASILEDWSHMREATSLTSDGAVPIPTDLSYIEWALWQPGKQKNAAWFR